MKKTILAFLILFIALCPFSVAEKVYPQLVLGGGYEVTLLVTNKLDTPWSGQALILQNRAVVIIRKT